MHIRRSFQFLLLVTEFLWQCSTTVSTNITPAVVTLAELHLKNGDITTALVYAQQAAENDPFSTHATLLYATALTWNGQYDQAQSTLISALQNHTTTATTATTNNSTMPNHDYLHCHRDLGNLLNYYYPNNEPEQRRRIIHHYYRWLDAIEQGYLVVPMNQQVGVRNDLALLLQTHGDIVAATAQFQQALILDPQHYQTRTNFGLLLVKTASQRQHGLEQQRLALNICRQRARAGETQAAAHLPRLLLNMGSVLDAQDTTSTLSSSDHLAKAMTLWQEAITLDPSLTLAWDALGNKFAGEGDILRADEHYARGVAAARAQGDEESAVALDIKLHTLLPRVYDNTDEIIQWRWRYMNRLRLLLSKYTTKKGEQEEDKEQAPVSATITHRISEVDPARAVLSMGYYLVYQGFDNRRPREMLANVYRSVLPSIEGKMDDAFTHINSGTGDGADVGTPRNIRVGFFSEYLFEHSTTKLIYNVVHGLSSRQHNHVDVHIIVPSHMVQDEMTSSLVDVAQVRYR